MNASESTAARNRLILVSIALLACGWILWRTRGALVPFAIGAVIAYILAPLVDRIQRLLPAEGRFAGTARMLAILVTYVLVLGIIALAALYFVPPLIRQTTDFFEGLPGYWSDIQREGNSLLDLYHQRVPETMQRRIEENLSALGSQIGTAVRTALLVTFSAVGTIIGVAAGLALLPLWLFYVLKDQHQGMLWFYQLWPERLRPDVRAVLGMIDDVLAAYIRGQLFLGLVIGVVTGGAMWAIGIQQPLMLGLVAGLLELIPILGPWIAFVIAALVTLATEPDRIIFVGIAFLGIQQLENTFLVPKVQGNALRLHPAVIMILIVVGGSLWGLWGTIMIVPLAAIARDIFVYLYHRLGDEETPAEAEMVAAPSAVNRESDSAERTTH